MGLLFCEDVGGSGGWGWVGGKIVFVDVVNLRLGYVRM